MYSPLELINSSKVIFLFKCLLLWFCLSKAMVAIGQTESLTEKIVITSLDEKIRVHTNKNGQLQVNVSPKDVHTFKRRGWVGYSDFGARGDGKTDDIDAIAATHGLC